MIPGERAEEFLLEEGAIRRQSATRRSILGCIACTLSRAKEAGKEPTFYGYQIIRCTGIKSGVLYPILRDLENLGAVTSEAEVMSAMDAGRPQRRIYSPVNTEWGQSFQAALETPKTCHLE